MGIKLEASLGRFWLLYILNTLLFLIGFASLYYHSLQDGSALNPDLLYSSGIPALFMAEERCNQVSKATASLPYSLVKAYPTYEVAMG
jgi:hypothetical protein